MDRCSDFKSSRPPTLHRAAVHAAKKTAVPYDFSLSKIRSVESCLGQKAASPTWGEWIRPILTPIEYMVPWTKKNQHPNDIANSDICDDLEWSSSSFTYCRLLKWNY